MGAKILINYEFMLTNFEFVILHYENKTPRYWKNR
jgi:hypothetical protein